MLENEKYATQLPLYFYFLNVIRDLSNAEFSDFVENFRNVLFVFQAAGGLFIYLIFRRKNQKFLGFSAAIFYSFNVWSLNSFIFLKQDMIAIALLLVSFYFFNHKKLSLLSYIFYGLSLGIKHIGIFAAPLYLAPLIFTPKDYKMHIKNIFVLFITVLAPCVPFLLDNPQSLINSMLFSVTRSPSNSEFIYGYSELLIKYNPAFNTGTLWQQVMPRLPLLLASLLAVALLVTKKIKESTYLFVSILVFAVFNPVIFPQYITWIPPLALLSIVDYIDTNNL